MKPVRLDKFLADAGIGTRSQVKQLLKKGTVTVNDLPAKAPETKVDPDSDRICFQGKPLTYSTFYYYLLHKPAGYVSATEDPKDPTVLSLLKDVPGRDLFPVGRLDKDTEGLLLITNDGALAHDLLSPRKHVDKTYFVRVRGILTQEDLSLLEAGVDIGEDAKTLPARARCLKTDPEADCCEAELTICEGKFHQVKRMFQAVGKPVLYLKRLSMGALTLDPELPCGAFRPLTQEEILALKNRSPAK